MYHILWYNVRYLITHSFYKRILNVLVQTEIVLFTFGDNVDIEKVIDQQTTYYRSVSPIVITCARARARRCLAFCLEYYVIYLQQSLSNTINNKIGLQIYFFQMSLVAFIPILLRVSLTMILDDKEYTSPHRQLGACRKRLLIPVARDEH